MRGKTILVTGGTGSFGQTFVKKALDKPFRKIVIYSRDEYKQVEMQRNIADPDKRIRYFIGNVRDKERLYRAFADVDCVIHAAALKHVSVCEYNPFEAIQTNIYGAQNIIEAAIDMDVEKVLAISSDKAVNPINLYGATKLCADKLFITANVYSPKSTKFSVIRYGNFAESRGSVIPYFRDLINQGKKEIPITDSRMTRFMISLEKAISLAFEVLKKMKGGEIFSPRMPSFKITDLVTAINPSIEMVSVGKGVAEKLHEDMILNDDAFHTYEQKKYYVTYPYWEKNFEGRKVPEDFSYSSDNNTEWLKKEELLS